MKNKILLFNPPYFRIFGSHNDKTPLSLSYLSRILFDLNEKHEVINGDFTGAKTYWRMDKLAENYRYFKDAVDGSHSLIDEWVEYIVGEEYTHVLILGGDPLIPTKDIGNPYLSAQFSKKIRKQGIKTIGFGPYFNLNPEEFKNDFDCLLMGEPSSEIKKALSVKSGSVTKLGRIPLDIIPRFEDIVVGDESNLLMTRYGCLYPCSFCIAGKQYRSWGGALRSVAMDTLVHDISKRKDSTIYLGDLNFGKMSNSFIKELSSKMKNKNIKKEFTIESRVEHLKEDRILELKELGVSTIKVGLEGIGKKQQIMYSKVYNIADVKEKLNLVKKHGIKLVIYIMLGGRNIPNEEYQETYNFLKEIKPDYVVVNIWGFDLSSSIKYDSQFSPDNLKKACLDYSVYLQFLDLQSETNPTVGIISYP